jgi:PAS domain S-box-containing protein
MRKRKILVVEDEKVVATDIEECLHKLGYSVVGAAASALGAIKRAVETEPDLVLMDIKLKGSLDGVDAAGELHDRLGIPVVYLTAYADGEILERAKQTSPAGYVLKPFDERALRSAVEIALHRHPQEQRLIESERRLITALRSIDEAVILTEHDGSVILMNRTAEILTGWKQADARGKLISDVFATVHGRTGAAMRAPVSRVVREGVGMGLGDHRVIVSKQGAETWIHGSAVPLRDDDGDVAGAALVFRTAGAGGDDAERTAVRSHHASRMETAGRLAGGIAEDFGRTLKAISEGGQLLLERLRSNKAARGELEKILEAASRAQRLADRLASFTRHRIARPRVVDLNELVGSLKDLLQCAVGEDVEVLTVSNPGTGKVNADPAHMELVILDLATACRDAMPGGGKLTIEIDDVELLGEYARAHTRLDPGCYVMLGVSHTGPAVPPKAENLEREMPTVCELISLAGGDLRVQSEPGRVTTYEVFLPRVD